MSIINQHAGTRVDEIAQGIYRISTPIAPNAMLPEGFTFNQFLVVDDEPLLFHTGPLKAFALVKEAVASVMPVERLRWVSFSHFESDECGSLNEWLAVAPHSQPLCGQIGAMISIQDVALRPPKVLADGEVMAIGDKQIQWLDTPHLPHGWDAGCIAELTNRTLFCGDLFTQGGSKPVPVTDQDILEPALRAGNDYYSNPTGASPLLEKLASSEPALLACMHGSSFRGDGARLLGQLGAALAGAQRA